jgi:quinoprotein dehydrogenase-associated probable ABC transporter substrate-binding protein
MPRTANRPYLGRCVTAALAALLAVSAPPGQAQERKAFKVCADPNYPPFSTKDRDGIENRLAEILAGELGLPVSYAWFPARIGFIRNTLRAEDPGGEGYKCDVVMNVPEDYELTITTRPYYTSAYSLVYVKGRGLDDVRKGPDLIALSDERKATLKVGMNERDPGTLWFAKYDMFDQIHGYQAQTGDLDYYPGRAITEDLFAGEISAAVLWGPLAGRAKRLGREQGLEVAVIPLVSEPGVRFHYSIALGTRHPDDDWRDRLDRLLQQNQDQIVKLLQEFEVPLVNPDGSLPAS